MRKAGFMDDRSYLGELTLRLAQAVKEREALLSEYENVRNTEKAEGTHEAYEKFAEIFSVLNSKIAKKEVEIEMLEKEIADLNALIKRKTSFHLNSLKELNVNEPSTPYEKPQGKFAIEEIFNENNRVFIRGRLMTENEKEKALNLLLTVFE